MTDDNHKLKQGNRNPACAGTATHGPDVIIYTTWILSSCIWVPKVKARLENYNHTWAKVRFLCKPGHTVAANLTAQSPSSCNCYPLHQILALSNPYMILWQITGQNGDSLHTVVLMAGSEGKCY